MPNGFYKEGFGVELPHPPISLSVFLVVEEALRVAWDLMRTQPRDGFDLLNANEDVVTQELYEVLLDVVFGSDMVEGFDDKMPDLLIGLVDRLNVFKPSQDWLFIECKPVDGERTVGVHYCDKGIIRFVRGEYAWTMTSVMMVAYARAGYTISTKLDEALNARTATIPTSRLPKPCRHSKAGRFADVVCVSQHGRTFRYVETGENAPSITVRHLWLRRN
jgi:hypothetical protein